MFERAERLVPRDFEKVSLKRRAAGVVKRLFAPIQLEKHVHADVFRQGKIPHIAVDEQNERAFIKGEQFFQSALVAPKKTPIAVRAAIPFHADLLFRNPAALCRFAAVRVVSPGALTSIKQSRRAFYSPFFAVFSFF